MPLPWKAFANVFCWNGFNPFTPRVSYGVIKVVLSSESVDEILWCDYSNETSPAVLLHGTIYIYVFYKTVKFDWTIFELVSDGWIG